jgi:retron-type reverse transcriptase
LKRHGGLWNALTSFSNLVRAAEKASRGKTRLANVARFHYDLEAQICRLQDELRDQTYQPGAYRTFQIFEPKPRIISAAPYRDRVVHHALCSLLEFVFEPTFISDSYACRRGKGTHAALDRFTEFARGNRYVLKCDVRKFFPSVDHEILKSLIARKIKDRDVLWLADRIIDHSNEQEPVIEWFAGDDLLTPSERRRGLPIGNQTSQFFANVYLNPFDHFVKETLRARGYIRYVDDFVVFSDDKEWLADVRERCREFLGTLRLRLHPNKSVISRVADGTRFLGFRVFPERRRLVRENVVRMKRRLRRMAEWYADGSIGAEQIRQRLMSWIGHAQHADTYRLRARLFGQASFSRRPNTLRSPRLCVRHSSCPQEVSRRGAEAAEE